MGQGPLQTPTTSRYRPQNPVAGCLKPAPRLQFGPWSRNPARRPTRRPPFLAGTPGPLAWPRPTRLQPGRPPGRFSVKGQNDTLPTTADKLAAWQAEQQSIQDEANEKRAEAAKKQIAAQQRDDTGKVQSRVDPQVEGQPGTPAPPSRDHAKKHAQSSATAKAKLIGTSREPSRGGQIR